VFSELLKLNKQKFTTGKKRLSIIKYTKRFKELIRKAGITDGNAIYQYSLGLTTDEYRSIALTNPMTVKISTSIAILLCGKEGCKEATTLSRLLVS
jgi:hypothetical protein